ncbi:MAG: hypothetical protein IPM34_06530 [Saprospiraceae bacterium]|nr:hypothetical protein [Saprospiraceae bacterium]
MKNSILLALAFILVSGFSSFAQSKTTEEIGASSNRRTTTISISVVVKRANGKTQSAAPVNLPANVDPTTVEFFAYDTGDNKRDVPSTAVVYNKRERTITIDEKQLPAKRKHSLRARAKGKTLNDIDQPINLD